MKIQRRWFFYGMTLFTFLIFLLRLYYLQVYSFTDLQKIHNNSSIKKINITADRGHIFDRNGKLLVSNNTYYKLMFTPNEIKNLDTVRLCHILGVDKNFFLKKVAKAKMWSPFLPSLFMRNISKKRYAILQSNMIYFRGFFVQKQNFRKYNYAYAANILGYLSEVRSFEMKEKPYYKMGDMFGIKGIERSYEKHLRGEKGTRFVQMDNKNRYLQSYKNGRYDIPSKRGKDITLSIDSDLQAYATDLMKGKKGGIVAIEPQTGEILAAVSTPTYHPAMMVGEKRTSQILKMLSDTIQKPLFDRSLLALYAPGSTFKILQSLIGLQEEVINHRTTFYCYGGYRYGRGAKYFMGCHCRTYGKSIRFKTAFAKSCNAYFAQVYLELFKKYKDENKTIDVWANYLKQFGLGNYLGYDFPSGMKGLVPSSTLYKKWYPNGWRATYTISNAIGQGQLLTTPIQLANMTVAVANRGFFYTPHFVKKIKDATIEKKYRIKNKIAIDSLHFERVVDGMTNVFKEGGTAYYSHIKGIEMCGKTGTVQNYKIINGKKVALPDHAIFVAFAPRKNPKIAICAYVENGGYGATIAAPIASLMIEKYLTNKTNRTRENFVRSKDLTKIYDKIEKLVYQENK